MLNHGHLKADDKAGQRVSPFLDPRTKLFILVIINLVVSTLPDLYTEWLCIGLISCVLCYLRLLRICLPCLAFYGAVMLLLAWTLTLAGMGAAFLSIIWISLRKLLPIFMFIPALVATTRVSELVAALQSMHVPHKVIVPFCVMLRFFPTAAEEFAFLRDAMKVRGLGFSFTNLLTRPLVMAESLFVPMLLRASAIAEELSAAAITRGIDSEGRRTSYCQMKPGWPDGVFVFCFAALAAVTLLGGVEKLK